MSGRRCGFWAGAGALIASLLLIASMGRASLVQASSSRQATQEFKVELDPQHPGRFPEGEFVGQILGGQSFTAAFEAHASWKYDLAISQGSLQQMAVSVSGHGGPQGGFARTLPVADRSSVNVSWTAATDGTVSITVTHLIADPKTYDPTALPEFQTARIRVVGVPYDDHADDPRKATLISLGETVSGHLELGTDQDAFSFFAQPGFDYRIDATVGKVSYLGGTFWDVEDFDRVDPALAAPLRLKPTQAAGVLIHGFNARRSGLHHFVLAGAGDNVNAPYTVRVSRTPITTTVNTSGVENDGACDADHCSLPEAIDASNTREGVQTIGFNIPGMGVHRISLPGTLPDIRDSVVIDGTVQPGYSGRPVIILDGRQAGFTHGVSVGAPFNGQLKVAGLAIVNFQRAGIHLAGGSGHTIIANVVGQDPATSSPAPNLDGGIVVSGGGGHVVGAPGSGNVIVSNGAFGLSLDGLDSGGASIQGNWIGTTPDQIAAGNGGPGLRIDGAGLGLRIGGVGEGAANTFANNAGPDLIIVTRGAPVEASIQGNRFSTTAGGGKAIVADLGTTGTVKVGGTGQGEGNHFVGPFLAAVELKVDGPQPRFQLVHAGNTHMGNLVGLRISEPPRGTVDVTESANELGAALLKGRQAARGITPSA